MQLTVRLFARLRERAGREALALEGLPESTPGGITVAELKRVLVERHPELGSLEAVRGVVGTSYVGDDARLSEGDDVSLLPPVSGGAPRIGDEDEALARGVFELEEGPLDPEACRRRVAHPTCGAVCVFTGVTRDTNRGRAVERLDYEAFAAMTGPEMARIFARCLELHGPPAGATDADRSLRMLCRHRVGTVGVGEPSVVIAVASPHRAAAFDAARLLIDDLKASLPIWKKEHYAGGSHWVGDRS